MPSAGPEAKSATLRDGTRLAYRLWGSPDAKQRVALIHSLAMDMDFWAPVAERLAERLPDRVSVLTYDCRGHGASGKSSGPYTVALFADDLAQLMDKIGWRSAVVAGASMGGCVTLAFAAAHAPRAAAIGLFDTTAWYGAEAPKQWEERAAKALAEGFDSLVAFQTTRWFGDAFHAEHPDMVQDAVTVFRRNDRAAYAEACRMLGAADLRSALPRMALPAAIVVGEQDYATPLVMAEALHAGIKGSTLNVLAGARHLTPLERPDDIAAALGALLDRAPAH